MILCLRSRKAECVLGLIITRKEYTSKEMEGFIRSKTWGRGRLNESASVKNESA